MIARIVFASAAAATIAIATAQSATAQTTQPAIEFSETERTRIFQHSPLSDPPPDPTNRWADDPAAARFGQTLFFDPRLSVDGRVSCAKCHFPQFAFGDGRPLAAGIELGTRNTPTLLNTAYNRWHFWDGRSDTLWSQALKPLERDIEMNSDRVSIVRLVAGDSDLRSAYEPVFGPLPDAATLNRLPPQARPLQGATTDARHDAWKKIDPADQKLINRAFANIGKAIAAYERKLISRNAPFDSFVEGLRTGDPRKLAAMSPAAQRGLKLFIGKGNCRSCHSGPNFTDGEFHDTRIPPRDGGPARDPSRYAAVPIVQSDPFNAAGEFSDDPTGRTAEQTRLLIATPDTYRQFKTPSLRNVDLTGPYMHQGQFATLEEVIRHYSTFERALPAGHHQESTLVPLNLTDSEIADLVAFLESLTGAPVPADLGRAP